MDYHKRGGEPCVSYVRECGSGTFVCLSGVGIVKDPACEARAFPLVGKWSEWSDNVTPEMTEKRRLFETRGGDLAPNSRIVWYSAGVSSCKTMEEAADASLAAAQQLVDQADQAFQEDQRQKAKAKAQIQALLVEMERGERAWLERHSK